MQSQAASVRRGNTSRVHKSNHLNPPSYKQKAKLSKNLKKPRNKKAKKNLSIYNMKGVRSRNTKSEFQEFAKKKRLKPKKRQLDNKNTAIIKEGKKLSQKTFNNTRNRLGGKPLSLAHKQKKIRLIRLREGKSKVTNIDIKLQIRNPKMVKPKRKLLKKKLLKKKL